MRYSEHKSNRDDVSQTGNWENYRNGFVNNERVEINTQFFNKVNKLGRLRFDYISTSRPRKGCTPLSSVKFEKLLKLIASVDEKLGLVSAGNGSVWVKSDNGNDNGNGNDLLTEEEELAKLPRLYKLFLSKIDRKSFREKWLRWQTSSRAQFKVDRAYAEYRRLLDLQHKAERKKEKGDKKKNKKKKKEKKKEEAKEGEKEKEKHGRVGLVVPVGGVKRQRRLI